MTFPLALLLFNLGVEAGPAAVRSARLDAGRAVRLLEIRWPRPVVYLPGYVLGTLGAYWAIDRIAAMVGGTG